MFFTNEKCGGVQLFWPLAKISSKETEEMIVETIKRIEAEAAKLEETVLVTGKERRVRVKHTLVFTMLDGKCRCVILSSTIP